MLRKLFLAHPRSLGESYAEHGAHAWGIGWRLTLAGLACCLHALVPGLFERTASNAVAQTLARMDARRAAAPEEPATP